MRNTRRSGAHTMNWISYGPHAWLLRFADQVGEDAFYRGRAIVTELKKHPPPGLVEFVPALTTILIEFDPQQADVEAVILPDLLKRLDFGMVAKISTSPIREIPACYDGPDLKRVADQNELTPKEVVEIHSSPI